MYKLIYVINGVHDSNYFIETETLEECISACIDAYNKNYQLFKIEREGKIIYSACEIYKLINKVYY